MIKHILGTLLLTLNTGANINVFPMQSTKPQPPQNRLVSDFSLTISQSSINYGSTTSGNYSQQYNLSKLSANNDAMMIKGNKVIQNIYYPEPGTTANNYMVNIATQNYDNRNLLTPKYLTIYQITTYENTQNVNQDFYLHNYFGFQTFHYPNYNTTIQKIKVRTTTYTSQEDWSQYIDRNDYGSFNYITNLQDEIESPTSGYRYTQTEQITTSYHQENNYTITEIITPLSLTKGTTTYMIQISQPIVELQSDTTTDTYISLVMGEWNCQNAIYDRPEFFNMKITGSMILAEGTQEIIDIPGLMFYILTMPFTFISGAFDLTLFPGTPYQVNIANLFMAIIAVMAFIFIITIIIKLKAGGGQ